LIAADIEGQIQSDMKKILVATDFSSTSLDAFQYALEWAREFNASIHLIHVYSGSFDPNEALVVSPMEGRQEHILRELDFFVNSAGEDESNGKSLVPLSRDARLGFASDLLVDLSEDFDMIIMGSTGRSGVVEKIFGSVASYVSRHARCPVIMVPKGVKYHKIDNILYASDLKSIEESSIMKVIQIAEDLCASVHFVHVAHESEDLTPLKERIFEEVLQKGKLTQEYYISTIIEEDVVEGLGEYQKKNPADLAVVVAQRRSFWDSILHKSITKRMALSPRDVPVMVLHLKDKV
jgi:nucleotide-binding universal stress UspA family protein